MWDLIVIRPTEVAFARLVGEHDYARRLQDYLFVDRQHVVTGTHLSLSLKAATLDYWGVSMGVRACRQILAEFSRYHRDPRQAETATGHEDNHQAGHSNETFERHYGFNVSMLSNVKPEMLFRNALSSTWWQYKIGLDTSPRHVEHDGIFSTKHMPATGSFATPSINEDSLAGKVAAILGDIVEDQVSRPLVLLSKLLKGLVTNACLSVRVMGARRNS